MGARDDLAAAAGDLAEQRDQIRSELLERFPDVAPELIRDTSGRYVLLDATVALVVALTALTT